MSYVGWWNCCWNDLDFNRVFDSNVISKRNKIQAAGCFRTTLHTSVYNCVVQQFHVVLNTMPVEFYGHLCSEFSKFCVQETERKQWNLEERWCIVRVIISVMQYRVSFKPIPEIREYSSERIQFPTPCFIRTRTLRVIFSRRRDATRSDLPSRRVLCIWKIDRNYSSAGDIANLNASKAGTVRRLR